jgi:hypothetical protein
MTAADVITFLIVSALIFAVLELVDRISGR